MWNMSGLVIGYSLLREIGKKHSTVSRRCQRKKECSLEQVRTLPSECMRELSRGPGIPTQWEMATHSIAFTATYPDIATTGANCAVLIASWLVLL